MSAGDIIRNRVRRARSWKPAKIDRQLTSRQPAGGTLEGAARDDAHRDACLALKNGMHLQCEPGTSRLMRK